MSVVDVIEVLKNTGYPVAYQMFKTPQKPPFLCVSEPFTNNMFADGKVNAVVQHVQVDLFEKLKSAEIEGKVEQALSSFAWEKQMEYDRDNGNGYEQGYEQSDGHCHCLVIKKGSCNASQENKGNEYGTSGQYGRKQWADDFQCTLTA